MIPSRGPLDRPWPARPCSARVSPARVSLADGLALVLPLAVAPSSAHAQGAGEAPAWRLEKVLPPQRPGESNEAEHDRQLPVGLGKIGDIEFWAPNRGLLITAGDPPTVPPGVWTYNGVEWRELATECGATDGRIAWAGPDEFWTVSDGRPGQTSESTENINLPPLEDNTLCHFADGQIVASYAHPAFQADSYLQMHAAGCFEPADCWFGGEPLEEPQLGGVSAALERQRAGSRTVSRRRACDREHEPARRDPVRGGAHRAGRSRLHAQPRTAGHPPHQPGGLCAGVRTGNRSAAVRREKSDPKRSKPSSSRAPTARCGARPGPNGPKAARPDR